MKLLGGMNCDGYESDRRQQFFGIMDDKNSPPDPSKFVSLGLRPNALLSNILLMSIGVDGACPLMGWKLFWGMKISCPDAAHRKTHSDKT